MLLFSDGRKTRFGAEVLRDLEKEHIYLYILLPHASTLYQTLDKLFAAWHAKFLAALEAWRKDNDKGNFYLPNPTRSIADELCFNVLLGNPGKDITPWLTLKSKKSS